MELLEGRQSVLSLCVKRRQLEALQFLVEKFPNLLREQDADGETILSFAIKYNYPEIIAYLSRHGAFRPITALIKHSTGMSTVAMSLIAQMAHAASHSPPGGYWQDDTSSHKAGKAVVASTHHGLYKLCMRSNNTAYVSAILTIVLLTLSPPQTSFAYTLTLLVMTIVALVGVSLGYGAAMVISNPVQVQPVRQVSATVGAAFAGVLVLALGMAVLKNAYTNWKEQNLQREDSSFTDRVFRLFYRLQL